MFSLNTTLLLALTSALTTSATVTTPPPKTTVSGLTITLATTGTLSAGCGTVDGSIDTALTFTPACPAIYTFFGTPAGGFTINTEAGPCGLVDSLFVCGAGITGTKFKAQLEEDDSTTIRFDDGGFTLQDSSLLAGTGVGKAVRLSFK